MRNASGQQGAPSKVKKSISEKNKSELEHTQQNFGREPTTLSSIKNNVYLGSVKF